VYSEETLTSPKPRKDDTTMQRSLLVADPCTFRVMWGADGGPAEGDGRRRPTLYARYRLHFEAR
jgi:hypothetical protein